MSEWKTLQLTQAIGLCHHWFEKSRSPPSCFSNQCWFPYKRSERTCFGKYSCKAYIFDVENLIEFMSVLNFPFPNDLKFYWEKIPPTDWIQLVKSDRVDVFITCDIVDILYIFWFCLVENTCININRTNFQHIFIGINKYNANSQHYAPGHNKELSL